MKHKTDYYRILKFSLIPVNLLLIFTFILNYFKLLPAFWRSIYVFYFVLIIDTIFVALKIKQIPENERDANRIVYLSKYFFLLSLIVLALNQFLKRQTITDNLFYIIGISISLGFLTFYSFREREEKNFWDERTKEIIEETRRGEEFWSKFPRLGKIPIVKVVVRWVYKEGWEYVSILALVVIVGFVLRVWNLGGMSLWVEEQFSTIAGNSIVNAGSPILGDTTYHRAYLYTLSTALFIRIFGLSEFSVRLLPLIVSTFTIIFIYIFLKLSLSKKYALLGAFIFSLSDFALLYARLNRFYIALSLLVIINIYFVYNAFILKKIKYLGWSYIFAFLIPGFEISSIIFLPIILLLIFLSKGKKTLKDGFIAYILLSLIGFFLFYSLELMDSRSVALTKESIPFVNYLAAFNRFDSFFFNFLSTYFVFLLISIFLVIGLSFYLKKNNLLVFSSLYLFINLLFLSIYNVGVENFHWDQRHISFLFPLLVINFIFFITIYHKELKRVFGVLISFIVMLLIIATLINPLEINSVINMKYGDSLEGTRHLVMSAEPYRSDYKSPYTFVNNNFQEGDIIIGDNFMLLPQVYLKHNLTYALSSDDDVGIVKSYISSNKRVWFIDTTFDMKKYHTEYRWGQVYKFLEKNNNKIIYIGLDNKTRVYLFDGTFE